MVYLTKHILLSKTIPITRVYVDNEQSLNKILLSNQLLQLGQLKLHVV